ncbi:finger protein [Morchella snyderi]|nr:finger protein [Morchella snyderi]
MSRQTPRITKERQRVSRACDACKKKKIRCSGTQPCVRCVEWSIECLYNAEYNRGKPRSRGDTLGRKEGSVVGLDSSNSSSSTGTIDGPRSIGGSSMDSSSIAAIISAARVKTHHHHGPILQMADTMMPSSSSAEDTTATASNSITNPHLQISTPAANHGRTSASTPHLHPSSLRPESYSPRNSPDPFHTDRQDQYVGSSSGVSFLLRVQKRLHLINSPASNSAIFPSSEGLPSSYDVASFILPPKKDAVELLEVYFSYAMPTYRFLHRPTVEGWLDEFYENFEEGSCERDKTAILLLIWAQAKKYSVLTKSQKSSDGGARYFHAAERYLSADTGPIRLTNVQARLCQCFYLLACSRLNHCRSLFGTIAHLIHALGLHRKPRKPLASTTTPIDHIEQECRKRVFWCAYNMDKYLSAVLGRPSIFHDDDVDQELPSEVNDEDLQRDGTAGLGGRSQCIMTAPVLHAKLGRILSGLLKELYSIHRTPMPRRVTIATHYTTLLQAWRASLPAFLDPDKVEPSLLIPILQRQSRMLSLAYAHSVILINRPFLLSSFASLKWRKGHEAGEYEENVRQCLDAAMIISGIVDDYSAGQQVFSAFWFTQYVAFCAVVILYVYTIQRKLDSPIVWGKYFEAAEKCQKQLMTAAKDNSLAQRYRIVLEELKLEATEQTRGKRQQQAVDTFEMMDGYEGEVWTEEIEETSPNSMMADLTSWEEFDYLVMDCMGSSGAATFAEGMGFQDAAALGIAFL